MSILNPGFPPAYARDASFGAENTGPDALVVPVVLIGGVILIAAIATMSSDDRARARDNAFRPKFSIF
jgi:hypothetical protein